MGSQKQSHRVRRMQEHDNILSRWQQEEVNLLVRQNHRLAKRLECYESRPAWWKFGERRKWEVASDANE